MEVKENWIEYINRMVEIKAISVSPESEVEAFCEDDFPNKYYVAKVHYDVNVIIDEANKMNKMVKNLLSLNQLEFGNGQLHFERFDIGEVIQSVVHSADILGKDKNIYLMI